MRLKLLISLLVITLLASGCFAEKGLPDVQEDLPQSEAELAGQPDASPQSSARETGEGDETPPAESSQEQPPMAPEELMNTELDISYEAYGADAAFLDVLAQLEDEEFLALTSKGNSFDIGDYRLHYKVDSHPYLGPVKLMVDSPNGNTQVLIDSAYGIQGMFFEDRETLCVEFTKLLHYEGGTGQFFFLNLSTGEVTESGYGFTYSGHSTHHNVYRKHHYQFQNAKDAMELGEADDIYLQDATGEFLPIIEYAASVQFIGDRIYYLGIGRQEVYSTDLEGRNKTLFHTFGAPVWSFKIDGDTLSYRDETGEYEDIVPQSFIEQ